MNPRLWCCALLAGLLPVTGCAAVTEQTPPPANARAQASDTARGIETSDFLADPVFAPPPASQHARTGAPVGAAIRGSADQARQLAMQIVDALRRGDAAATQRAFADPVLRVRAGRYMLRQRLASQCLRTVARLGWHADSQPKQVIDTEHIEVEALRSTDDTQPLPPGLLGRDLRVRVRVRVKPGMRGRPTDLPCLSHIYVRTGASPMVVAID